MNNSDLLTWITAILLGIIGACIIAVTTACTGMPSNANSTNPAVDIEDVEQVTIDQETESTTIQKSQGGEVNAGDGSTQTNVFGMSDKERTASIGLSLFILLMCLLVELKLKDKSDCVIFATAVSVLLVVICLII